MYHRSMSKFRVMRYILVLFLGVGLSAISQENINQYDANGLRDGVWKKSYPGTQQLRYEGQFVHGREVGTFRFYCETCGEQPSTIIEYQEDGLANITYYTASGKRVSTGSLNGRDRVGEWLYYHENSQDILTREIYEDGKLHGLKQTYYPNGQLTEEQRYRRGVAEGANFYYSPEGTLLKKLQYENGKLHGPAYYYDAAGNLLIAGSYKMGQKDGLWKYYENGKLIKDEKFPKDGTK